MVNATKLGSSVQIDCCGSWDKKRAVWEREKGACKRKQCAWERFEKKKKKKKETTGPRELQGKNKNILSVVCVGQYFGQISPSFFPPSS